jgi:hypothetical protein
MSVHGLGFGYRVAEEAVRYLTFARKAIGSDTNPLIDNLLVQKVLSKLRGSERQRGLLTQLASRLSGFPQASAHVEALLKDLDEFGSFQSRR